jgi:hypothetical protein
MINREFISREGKTGRQIGERAVAHKSLPRDNVSTAGRIVNMKRNSQSIGRSAT